MRWLSWLGAVAAVLMFVGVGAAAAVTSDRAAAIVDFPAIAVGPIVGAEVDGALSDLNGGYLKAGSIETLVQLSNVSDLPVNAHCFYENANAHCTVNGVICNPLLPPPDCGMCVPGWNEIDFWVRLTPRQPMAWVASEGLTSFKLPGNTGSRIPPVPEVPFIGALKCIVVDDTGTPTDQNVLKGEATFVETEIPTGATSEPGLSEADDPEVNIAKYNAVGIRAYEGAVNDDRELVLGGPEPEYEGCPSVLILNHFFDGVVSPANPPASDDEVITGLVLVPCEEDFLRQIPGSTVVQYLVFNEFEQRFSTSRTVDCQQALQLSMIDTTQPDRSIFSAGVAGTTVGQTRMAPLQGGLLGMAIEFHGDQAAAFNLHYQGEREEPDLITLP